MNRGTCRAVSIPLDVESMRQLLLQVQASLAASFRHQSKPLVPDARRIRRVSTQGTIDISRTQEQSLRWNRSNGLQSNSTCPLYKDGHLIIGEFYQLILRPAVLEAVAALHLVARKHPVTCHSQAHHHGWHLLVLALSQQPLPPQVIHLLVQVR